MKLRVMQVLFVTVSILCAALIVRHGQPHLLAATSPQGRVGGRAPDARPADRLAAIAAIQGQLDAFRKDDFPAAIRYQSHALQRQFPSLEAFRQMMHAEYPAFLHFRSVMFDGARTPDQGRHVFVLVTLSQADGSLTRAVYLMVREGSTYKVDGVGGGGGMRGEPGLGPQPTPGGPSRLT